MAESGTMNVGGQEMKLCPGWDGNGFRCGKGSPRLIRKDAEVCENCSRGMRKRGQQTREEQERQREREERAKRRIANGVHAVEEALIPKGGAGITAGKLRVLVETLEGIPEEALDPGSYWRRDKISVADRWAILRSLAGLPADGDKGGR